MVSVCHPLFEVVTWLGHLIISATVLL